MPLTAIVETLQPKAAEVHGMGGKARVISIRNKFTPLIDIGRELGYRAGSADPMASVVILVETEGGGRSALLVDAIQGQRQVVIKSLEANYRHVAGHCRGDDPRRRPRGAHSRRRRGRSELACRCRGLRTSARGGRLIMINDTHTETTRGRELIAFRIGAQEFCVDIMAVREIRGYTPATALPQAPSFVRGVINLRGAVLAIVDLAARLGFPPAEPTARHVIMVVNIENQVVGLLVDAVLDILTVEEAVIQPTPDVASEMARLFTRGVLAIDGRMISLIGLDHVLPPPQSEAA